MTEVPEHLLRRSRERLEALGINPDTHSSVGSPPEGLPDLFATPDTSKTPTHNPDDALDWARFGDRPLVVARLVLSTIQSAGPDVMRESKAISFRKTNAPEVHYALSEQTTRRISDDLYLRLGHVATVVLEKPVGTKVLDSLRNFGRDVIEERTFSSVVASHEIPLRSFQAATESDTVTKRYGTPWAEILVDTNGAAVRGSDMLTAFSLRIADNPPSESEASVTDERTLRYWGSNAEVVYPWQTDSQISHKGIYTLKPHDYLSPANDLEYGINALGLFHAPGLKWLLVNEGNRHSPVTNLVEVAMKGLEVSCEMLRDAHIAEKVNEYDDQLQGLLHGLS